MLAFLLLPLAAALRADFSNQGHLNVTLTPPNLGLGIAAVSKYAGGNCQFMPAFDVAAFLLEEAPAAANGVGMLAKPAVTAVKSAVTVSKMAMGGAKIAQAAEAAQAVTAGAKVVTGGAKTLSLVSKASMLGKVMGGALSMSNPAGVAWTIFNAGMTLHQLYQVQQIMKDPDRVCELLAEWVPPYDHSKCSNPGPLPIPMPVNELAAKATSLDGRVVLAAGAVLFAASGALVLWHKRLHSVAYDEALCPRDRWLEDPALWEANVGQMDEEDEEDPFTLWDVPMPRCNGLKWVHVPTSCTDLGCRHRSCQQACCDSKNCTMYQFDASPGKCWLGDTASFNSENCVQWVGRILAKNSFVEDSRMYQQIKGLREQPRRQVAEAMRSCPEKLSQDACTLKVCQEMCMKDRDCELYQFRVSKAECWLGTEHVLPETAETWHGGLLDSSTPADCGAGLLCGGHCVDSCEQCAGFSLPGQGRCMRSAEEAVCNPGSWQPQIRGSQLNATQCQGLTRVVVKVDEDTEYNGHAVCQAACCEDPRCVLYQVRQSAAEKVHRKAGEKVHCWLGLVDSSMNELFSCPEHAGGWLGDRRKWAGGFLPARGCSTGHACLLTDECVDSCASQCPGAPRVSSSGACTESPDSEELKSSALPVVSDEEGGYFLSAADTAAADTLLMITQNKQRLIEAPTEQVCQSLSFGAKSCSVLSEDGRSFCSCKYAQRQECSKWFKDAEHARPVISEGGLLLLTGRGCDCFDTPIEEDFVCHFEHLEELPLLRLEGETSAFRIP